MTTRSRTFDPSASASDTPFEIGDAYCSFFSNKKFLSASQIFAAKLEFRPGFYLAQIFANFANAFKLHAVQTGAARRRNRHDVAPNLNSRIRAVFVRYNLLHIRRLKVSVIACQLATVMQRERFARRRARRKLTAALNLSLMVGAALYYTIVRGILSDFKFSRWFPRLVRELQRDCLIDWHARLQEARVEPPYVLTERVPVFIITLDSAKERSQHLRQALTTQEIEFSPFPAVDGRSSFSISLLNIFAGPRRKRTFARSFSLMAGHPTSVLHERLRFACFLTHVTLWKRLLSSAASLFLIMEDDVYISSQFMEKVKDALSVLPAHWDILYLGCTFPRYGGELRQGVYQLRGALGTFGYIISNSGASKMFSHAVHSDKPIDHVLDSAIYSGVISAFHIKPSLITHRGDLQSTLAYE